MKKPVLVLGGGIAGVQASLDLAEMDVPVFMVESSPGIGGRMAQLDKTFPTNDCSACILAPKVTSCYNHPLVKTYTWSELIDLKGEEPNFTAVIKKKARFIDEDLCKGCNACIHKCPIERKSEFDMGVGNRRAVYKPYAQAVPNKVVIDKKGTSPCKYNCPAHIDAHGYVALIGKRRYSEALEVVRRTTPFAGVLGRICQHPCEAGCSRKFIDSPVSLSSLKRFAADYEIEQGITPKVKVKAKSRDVKVAVVGSGPAGLSCAYQLALEGYHVTIFEAQTVPGGLLRLGIPDFKLDKKVVDREIQIVKDMGVEIICSTPIGKDLTITDLKKRGYKAVYLAVGAHRQEKIGIPGEDTCGVISAIEFLRELNLGKRPQLGKKVVVTGGTAAGIYAARSAVRLGCDVTVIYHGSGMEVPLSSSEIQNAIDEGINFEYSSVPEEVVTDGCRVTGLKYLNKDSSLSYSIAADTIISAGIRKVDDNVLSEAGYLGLLANGKIVCNTKDLNTGVPGVFAGGEAVTGPTGMITAVAQGNMAARAIRNYLESANLLLEPFMLPETRVEDMDFYGASADQRTVMPLLEANERIKTFEEVEKGLTEDKAVTEALRCINCSICSECRMCEKVCSSKAICHEQVDEVIELPVSSVIFANGYDPSSEMPDGYGYGKYKDVVTSLEYERILSASGPFQGNIKRPSDGRVPGKIAFIQCVGSRDEKCDSRYCSAVCCMYAVKEAVITREHLSSVKDIDIFYMDMRAFGKDFDKYVDSAKSKHGIQFIRSRVSDVVRNESTGSLILKYCSQKGDVESREYDMVVLSVGLIPNREMKELFEKAGVKTDRHGFVWMNEFDSPSTSREGIFACGAAAGPKDIPETVIEASAAASEASIIAGRSIVDSVDYTQFFKREEETAFLDISRQPVRIGVFLCHCGKNIGGFLDVKEVVKYAKTLPGVEYATDFLYACSVDSQKAIAERIKKFNLNRIVVASCSPRTHETLFQKVLSSAGLNQYLLTMANIRDQCSWVHMGYWKQATEKAKDLTKMAVAKAAHAQQLTRQKIGITKSALIIGGGVSGMAAALKIAGMGYKAFLVEKNSTLGGNALNINSMFSGRPTESYLKKMTDKVSNNSLIEVLLNAKVKSISGYMGNYTTNVDSNGHETQINHGAVIIATGAAESKPIEYLYGEDKNILTQMELETALKNNSLDLSIPRNIFMIQCVGSRNADRPYCSRVCCNQAIKNALHLKESNPATSVTVLYRDIRSYGLNEANYRKARRAGIQFVRYEPERKPEILKNEAGLAVKFHEPLLDACILSKADMLVLSTAIEPDVNNNRKIAQMLKVPLNQDGFFLEAHAKLRPVDFATEGIYLCGLAHNPRTMKESILQGKAAAARAATVISKEMLETEGAIAEADEALCSGCGTCETVCAYKAVSVEEVKMRDKVVKKAVVNPVLCKGCGTCSASCRCGAIDINGFTDRQVINEIEYLLRI